MISFLNRVSIDRTASFQHRYCQKRIFLFKLCGSFGIDFKYLEVRTVKQQVHLIFRQSVCGKDAVCHFFCGCLYDVDAFFQMQLTRLAVAEAVVIVQSVGYVAVLLCFENQASAFDGMNCAWVDHNKVALFNRHFPQQVAPFSLFNHLYQFFFCLCLMADN